ncbi:hypothetical protein L7E55_10110 [Pelotomaculum isophthalicicum JI]|uniref:CRISPR system Cms protein Csm4 n=1 Tax=Pelotomaculum isophthalicicum JI TaxID=947010 RepID=A0A9X4H892_9FIRM|nr:hypothetical protein [Pelotomaculum isophthalicicum]MDF9408704.1 hypothetical protein [Pelotomaculum isophthalicicum JI]
METYRLKLRMKSGFISPLQADTIFGGLCWTIRYAEGNDSINSMLGDFRSDRPWFVLSNAFPGDLLPKPLMKIKRPLPATRDEQLLQAREGKRLKKIEYLTPKEFISLISGSMPVIENREKPISQVSTLHNQINRISGSTADGGQLFEQMESYINQKDENNQEQDYLSIYIKLREPGLRDWLLDQFRLLGQTGIGKRKSTGKGSFSVIEMEKCELFESIKEPNAYLSLSNFVPRQGDPTEGYYKTFVKYGKLGEEYALSSYPFKHPLLMIRAGSVFFTKGGVKPFYGQMVENIAPTYPEVLQYALAFSVPVRMNGDN